MRGVGGWRIACCMCKCGIQSQGDMRADLDVILQPKKERERWGGGDKAFLLSRGSSPYVTGDKRNRRKTKKILITASHREPRAIAVLLLYATIIALAFLRCSDMAHDTTAAEAFTSSTGKALFTNTCSTTPSSRPNRRHSPPAGPPSTRALRTAASKTHSRTWVDNRRWGGKGMSS